MLEDTTREQEAIATRAIARADETFDLSLAQSVPGDMSGNTWALVANGTGQVVAAGKLIVGFVDMNRKPVGCPGANDLLILTAHDIRNRSLAIAETITKMDQPLVEVPMDLPPGSSDDPNNPLTRLRESVNNCMHLLESEPTSEIGASALTLVWAQDWLIHLDWVINRIEYIAAKAQSQPVPATPAPAT